MGVATNTIESWYVGVGMSRGVPIFSKADIMIKAWTPDLTTKGSIWPLQELQSSDSMENLIIDKFVKPVKSKKFQH